MALTDDQKKRIVTIEGLEAYHAQMAETIVPGLIEAGTALNVSGTVAIANGGTGATTAAGARSNLGLGNVGNFKAVSTVASQGLSSTEKSNARANIGAGTSSFSGSYTDLTNVPSSFTPASHTHATSIATSTGTSQLTLGFGAKYALSAGGTSYIFTMPANPNTNTTYKLTLNGTDVGGGSTSLGTVYGPTTAGTAGQYLKSSGSGAPVWQNFPTSLPASDVSAWAKAASKPSYTKSEVGLGNVTNDAQVKRSEMGVANGVATLDANGLVPSSQLPSFVDDIIELLNITSTAPTSCAKGDMYYNNGSSNKKIYTATAANTWGSTGATPEAGKIYVNLNNSKTYRWSGSDLVVISETLAIGTTSSTAAAGNHTHTTTIAADSGSNQLTLAFGTKYKLTAGGTSYIFTMPSNPNTNTTYTFATGDSNGQFKVTPSGGSAQNVSIKGLGSAAYTESSAYATSGHTHDTSLAASDGTSGITLAFGSKYSLTAGGTSYIFTMPSNPNTDTKVTSVGNHYTPSADSNAALSASASGATAAWSIDVVKGITLSRDAKGHVTNVSVTSGKIPANPNTDTSVTSAANHYTPSRDNNADKSASASGASAAWSIDVVKGVTLQTDGKGHVTGISVTSGKLPANPNTDTKVTAVGNHYTPSGGTTTSASGGTVVGSGTLQLVSGVTKDAAGHVTGVASTAIEFASTTDIAAIFG